MKYEKFHEMCDSLDFNVYEEKPGDIVRERQITTLRGILHLT